MFKFHSYDKGLRVFKDGSIVAIFINGKFETDNLDLALFLLTIEQVTCISNNVINQPEVIEAEKEKQEKMEKEKKEKDVPKEEKEDEKVKVKSTRKKKV